MFINIYKCKKCSNYNFYIHLFTFIYIFLHLYAFSISIGVSEHPFETQLAFIDGFNANLKNVISRKHDKWSWVVLSGTHRYVVMFVFYKIHRIFKSWSIASWKENIILIIII